MSAGRICDYCGAAVKGGFPAGWLALMRHEGETSKGMFDLGGERPTETRREFCSEDCVRGWLTNKVSLAEAVNQ